jgi:hypothetical protein
MSREDFFILCRILRKPQHLYSLVLLIVALIFFAVSAAGGFADERKAQEALQSAGMTQVSTSVGGFWACGKAIGSVRFTAVLNGRPVKGTVCQKLIGDSSIVY